MNAFIAGGSGATGRQRVPLRVGAASKRLYAAA